MPDAAALLAIVSNDDAVAGDGSREETRGSIDGITCGDNNIRSGNSSSDIGDQRNGNCLPS